MRVTFSKIDDKGRRLCYWEALRGKRTRVPGTTMAGGAGIPHDIAQYVVEAATGLRYGFWGCVEQGATFRSTGRRRTKPGRAVIAQHRPDLAVSERLATAHLAAWRAGQRTAVTELLDRAMAQWGQLGPGEHLVFVWPSPRREIRPADAPGHGSFKA